jgi:hypothetical protein
MTNKELKSLIKTLRSLGVVSYEREGLKLLLDPNHVEKPRATKSASRQEQQETLHREINTLPVMTDEEWLLSTNPMSDGSDA